MNSLVRFCKVIHSQKFHHMEYLSSLKILKNVIENRKRSLRKQINFDQARYLLRHTYRIGSSQFLSSIFQEAQVCDWIWCNCDPAGVKGHVSWMPINMRSKSENGAIWFLFDWQSRVSGNFVLILNNRIGVRSGGILEEIEVISSSGIPNALPISRTASLAVKVT